MLFKKVISAGFTGANKQERYSCYMNGEEIVEYYRTGLLGYNHEIQRGLRLKKKDGVIEEVPLVNERKIKAISEDLKSGLFFPSTLLFNVMTNDGEFPKMKMVTDEDGIPCLEVDDVCEILDGFHRISGLLYFAEEIESKRYKGPYGLDDYMFLIEITGLTKSECQNRFYQLSLSSPISKTRIEYLNTVDAGNLIIRELMSSSLKDKVETSKNVISKNNDRAIVTFSTLVSALEQSVKLDMMSSEELDNFTYYLDSFFSELFALKIMEPFGEDATVRKQKGEQLFAYENFTFYGYVGLACYIYSKLPECKERDYAEMVKMVQFLECMDFDRESSKWESVVNVKEKDGKFKYILLNNKKTRRDFEGLFVREFNKLVDEKKDMDMI